MTVASMAIMIRSIKTVHSTVLNVHYGIFGSVINLLYFIGETIYNGGVTRVYSGQQYMIMILAGLLNGFAMLMFTKAN
jgi:hypothetical protein